jgi:hypothetical protein
LVSTICVFEGSTANKACQKRSSSPAGNADNDDQLTPPFVETKRCGAPAEPLPSVVSNTVAYSVWGDEGAMASRTVAPTSAPGGKPVVNCVQDVPPLVVFQMPLLALFVALTSPA